MSNSTNRIAAITGGASGIGLAFAELWVSQGGRVVLLDMNAEAISSAVENLGGEAKARGVVTDVTNNDSVVAAFESIRLN
ncbi:MAG: SDR family NAD(P)-dependent oxidoreductase, partial [Actinobacteria bacterium]|nr:SDR family NAD(P)-dependent oxidoreductase [Actinomycetota bacterium]